MSVIVGLFLASQPHLWWTCWWAIAWQSFLTKNLKCHQFLQFTSYQNSWMDFWWHFGDTWVTFHPSCFRGISSGPAMAPAARHGLGDSRGLATRPPTNTHTHTDVHIYIWLYIYMCKVNVNHHEYYTMNKSGWYQRNISKSWLALLKEEKLFKDCIGCILSWWYLAEYIQYINQTASKNNTYYITHTDHMVFF